MSSHNPRPRRRIAGERRPARPDEVEAGTGLDERPVTPEETDRSKAPRVSLTKRSAPVAPVRRGETSEQRPGDTGGAADGTARRGGPSRPVVAALGVMALLLVAVAAVLGLGVWPIGQVRDQGKVDQASRLAPASAERASAAILSYDYQSLDADEKAAERYMTPSYKKKYADTFNRLVRPNAAKLKAKVEAEVKASGVAHADAGRVNVLLYVNQTTTSTANGGAPQLALNRVQLSMVQQGGRWLVNDITSY